jgi:hypothetical protein
MEQLLYIIDGATAKGKTNFMNFFTLNLQTIPLDGRTC